VCGGYLLTTFAFVIGPMCATNRISAEPPSHVECAIFSATACPFLTKPKAVRREANLPDAVVFSATGLERNPGVTLVWATRHYKPFRAGRELLFEIGDPIETRWYREGRTATREEVLESVNSGLPLLREIADTEKDPVAANQDLDRRVEAAEQYYPEA
jgi:hypothetical protein